MERLQGSCNDSRRDDSNAGTSAVPSTALISCRGVVQALALLAARGWGRATIASPSPFSPMFQFSPMAVVMLAERPVLG